MADEPSGIEMLSYDDTAFGEQDCELNLALLYPEMKERDAFKQRFKAFAASDEFTGGLFDLLGDMLRYRTEVFTSDRIDDRRPLLLLLGNPASHSVVSGFAFAFEKSESEHRFWKVLREVGILSFYTRASIDARREALRDLQYSSPFRIGIAVFHSIPSPASAPGWSGVHGLRRLLGAKAFRAITTCEEVRIRNLVSRFIGSTGSILVFQKDAYEGVRSPDTPVYSLERANLGLLVGRYKLDANIRLAGAPPTRLMHSARAKQVLAQQAQWLPGGA